MTFYVDQQTPTSSNDSGASRLLPLQQLLALAVMLMLTSLPHPVAFYYSVQRADATMRLQQQQQPTQLHHSLTHAARVSPL